MVRISDYCKFHTTKVLCHIFFIFFRSSIQANPNLRTVDDFNGLLCVQSKENKLLMRGIVIKEIDDKSVSCRDILPPATSFSFFLYNSLIYEHPREDNPDLLQG